MRPGFSSYLDIVRFLAAFLVFVGHAAGVNWTGGLLWQTGAYGDTCVVVFFVLSGFVIAYVADNKEKDWRLYGASRIARMWSVVIPALLLTCAIDAIGVRVAPQLYIDQPWFNGDHLALRYLTSFFMLHETWHINYAPGINQPFWSLGYEAYYYLLFGLLVFLRGRARILAVLAVLAIGGPLVALLFPVWLLGVAAYHRSKTLALSTVTAGVLFCATTLILLLSPLYIRDLVSVRVMGQEVAGRYVDGIVFFVNLLAAHQLFSKPRNVGKYEGMIKKIASITFVLYLFHRPLLQFFSYIGPVDPASWQRRLLVIGGTLAVVVLATPMCERLQRSLRHWCLRVFNQRNLQVTDSFAERPRP